MIDANRSPFDATGQATDQMFQVLGATGDDVVAVRVDAGTPAGYSELYDLLVEKSDEHGTVHVYEEAPNWTLSTYLSHLHGVVPDLRTGPELDIDRYAAVGDSRWLKVLYYQWVAIAPVWPVAPDEMRLYSTGERRSALEWVKTGGQRSELSQTDRGDGR